MKRVLRYSELPINDENVDGNGAYRPLCAVCGEPIIPGQIGICITQFDTLYSKRTREDVYQDAFMEDGDAEKIYHYGCIASVVPNWVVGAEPDGSLL